MLEAESISTKVKVNNLQTFESIMDDPSGSSNNVTSKPENEVYKVGNVVAINRVAYKS